MWNLVPTLANTQRQQQPFLPGSDRLLVFSNIIVTCKLSLSLHLILNASEVLFQSVRFHQ